MIRIKNLVFTFTFCFIYTISWSANIDSLVASLETEKDFEIKITALNDLCFYVVYSDPDKAMEYGRRAIALSQAHNKQKLEGKAWNRIGIVYDVTSKWDSALVAYTNAVEISTPIEDTLNIASANTNIGLIRWHQHEYDKAVEHFLLGIEGFEALGRDAGVASCYNNISLIYMDQGRYEKSKIYLRKALKIRRSQDNNYALADVLINLSSVYSEDENNLDSAKLFVDEAIQIFEFENDHYGLGNGYNTLGYIHKKWGNIDSAAYYMEKSYKEHKAIGNKRDMLSSLYNLSLFKEQMGQQKARHELLLESQELAEEVGDLKIKMDVYNSLGLSYQAQGEYKKAAESYEIKGILSDSIQKIERDEMAERLELEFQTAKKDNEIAESQLELLQSSEQKAKDDLKISNRNSWIFSLGLGFIGLLFFGLFIITRNKKRSEAEKVAAIIEEKELRINEIIEAREVERERLSRDLHDGICQTLTALRLQQCDVKDQIAKTDPETAQLLQKSIDTTSAVYNEARQLSHQLLPAILEKIGLVESIRQLLEFSLSSTQVTSEFTCLVNENVSYHKELEIALYRICQELLNNCLKHANAKHIDIQLYERENNAILIVEDNGKGFNADDKNSGAGLHNIEQRVSSLLGEFHIASGESQVGSTATIRIPVKV